MKFSFQSLLLDCVVYGVRSRQRFVDSRNGLHFGCGSNQQISDRRKATLYRMDRCVRCADRSVNRSPVNGLRNDSEGDHGEEAFEDGHAVAVEMTNASYTLPIWDSFRVERSDATRRSWMWCIAFNASKTNRVNQSKTN